MSLSAQAREDVVPGSLYTSARAAGMADAFSPLADDTPSALFYNPAAIAKTKKAHFEPLNLGISMNADYVGTLDSNFYNIYNLSAFKSTLQNNPFTMPGAGATYIPSFAIPELGPMPAIAGGMLLDTSLASSYNNGAYMYRSRYMLVPALGLGWTLAHGIIHIGYTMQWINEDVGTIQPAPLPLSYTTSLNQGSAFSHNVGFMMTLPMQFLPTINLIGRNLFGTTFSSTDLLPLATSPAGVPTALPMTFDGAFSISPRIGSNSFLNWVMIYRDFLGASGVNMLTRLTAGAEFEIKKTLFLRAGFGSGYPSAGIGYKKSSGEIQLAWSGEEIGMGGFQNKIERRWIVQFQARAF